MTLATRLKKLFLAALTLRVHIVLNVFAAYMFFALVLKGRPTWRLLAAGLCVAAMTQGLYLVSKSHDDAEDALNMPQERLTPRQRRACRFAGTMLLAAPFPYLFLAVRLRAVYCALALIGLFYSRPLGPRGLRIKDHAATKVAAILIFSCCAILAAPFQLLGAPLIWAWRDPALMTGLVANILVLTLLFDIRDKEGDRRLGIRTLPVILGVRGTIALLGALIAVHAGIAAMRDGPGWQLLYNAGLLVSLRLLPGAGDPRLYHLLPLYQSLFLLALIFAGPPGRG